MLYDALVVYRDMLHDEESTPEGSPGLSPLEELGARCPCCFGPRKEGDLAKNKVDHVVSVDGNFNHSRPEHAAADDFKKAPPPIFLPAAEVDEARRAVDEKDKRKLN